MSRSSSPDRCHRHGSAANLSHRSDAPRHHDVAPAHGLPPPYWNLIGTLERAVGGVRERRKPCIAGLSLSSGGGIRTRDLRVMSPTSYQTAPPRGVSESVAQ